MKSAMGFAGTVLVQWYRYSVYYERLNAQNCGLESQDRVDAVAV